MPIAAANRLTLDAYRREMGLPPVEAAPGRRGTGGARDVQSPPVTVAKPNKYRAQRTVGPGGRTYDSKAEARMAQRLEEERQAGGIVAWVPQVSLPCGRDENGRNVRYRADALVALEVRPDGSFVGRLLDRKGIDTPTSRTKRAALRSLYGLDVQVIGDLA